MSVVEESDEKPCGGYDADWGMGNELPRGEGVLGENGPVAERVRACDS